MNVLLGYTLTYTYLISILVMVELLQRKCKIKNEITRKLVHILVGFSWIIMVYFFGCSFHLVIPPLSFVIINYISYKKNLILSMEREDNSFGTIYYALSFSILSIITVFYNEFLPYYGIGVFTMCLGDGLAPFIGQKFKTKKLGKSSKTFAGSLTVFIMGVLSSVIIGNYFLIEYNLLDYFIIGLVSAILEFFGDKYDNITLPIGVSFLTFILSRW